MASIQNTINSNSDGSLNSTLFNEYVQELYSKDYEELQYPFDDIGDSVQIKYTRTFKNGIKFCSGGFLVQNNRDYFIFKGHTGKLWSLQKNEIVRLFARTMHLGRKNKKPVIFRPLIEENKIPLVLGGTVVYRAKNNSLLEKFKKSKKYIRALNGSKFVVND
jgi:hypothetical protein